MTDSRIHSSGNARNLELADFIQVAQQARKKRASQSLLISNDGSKVSVTKNRLDLGKLVRICTNLARSCGLGKKQGPQVATQREMTAVTKIYDLARSVSEEHPDLESLLKKLTNDQTQSVTVRNLLDDLMVDDSFCTTYNEKIVAQFKLANHPSKPCPSVVSLVATALIPKRACALRYNHLMGPWVRSMKSCYNKSSRKQSNPSTTRDVESRLVAALREAAPMLQGPGKQDKNSTQLAGEPYQYQLEMNNKFVALLTASALNNHLDMAAAIMGLNKLVTQGQSLLSQSQSSKHQEKALAHFLVFSCKQLIAEDKLTINDVTIFLSQLDNPSPENNLPTVGRIINSLSSGHLALNCTYLSKNTASLANFPNKLLPALNKAEPVYKGPLSNYRLRKLCTPERLGLKKSAEQININSAIVDLVNKQS